MQIKAAPALVSTYAGVDWLSCTVRGATAKERVSEAVHAMMQVEIDEGARPRLWTNYGYEGWYIKGLRWGRRQQDDLLSLSGEYARDNWEFFIPLASNVSRVDLQVSCKLRDSDAELAARIYVAIRDRARVHPLARTYTLVTSVSGGDTLYVGRRSSVQMGRMYDKGLQSKEKQFENSWRYEVEYKGQLAGKIANLLKISEGASKDVCALVHTWFEQRLVSPIFEAHSPHLEVAISKRRTSDEALLAWLSQQVAPSVRRLLGRGKGAEVKAALGLDGPRIP